MGHYNGLGKMQGTKKPTPVSAKVGFELFNLILNHRRRLQKRQMLFQLHLQIF